MARLGPSLDSAAKPNRLEPRHPAHRLLSEKGGALNDARAGFWEAICAEPDEDAHRLVYADWLEDNGEAERADFIRAQCELARLPFGDERRTDLQIRERAALEVHRDEWRKELPKWTQRDTDHF